MKVIQRYCLLVACALLTAFTPAGATITLPKVIGSNMVLQRNQPVTIWGAATAGERIKVSFNDQVKTTIANANGTWIVTLAKMSASDRPADMTIAGTNTIILSNILVGEVWLCSGQSNMEYTMTKSSKYAHALRSSGLSEQALKQEKNSNIRLFLVKRDLTRPSDINKGWEVAEGTAVGTFSAAGYHFAKQLQQELKVPVGMIAASVSGSNIEPWMSGAVEKDNTGRISINEAPPGKFYAGMIRPLAPFALKGFLWYQGETNCILKETDEYTLKFRHLISSWRKLWRDPGAPFYFVQIAPFNYAKSKGDHQLDATALPLFREAQAAALDIPNTAMVITTDLVDNLDDIHPTYKWEVGRRLALLALSGTYGKKKMVSSGPVMRSVRNKGDKLEVRFSHTAKGLMSNDGLPLSWFTVAGTDGRYMPAQAIIKGNKVIVSSDQVRYPVNVRFGWHESAQPNLCNSEGLPARPFRSLEL